MEKKSLQKYQSLLYFLQALIGKRRHVAKEVKHSYLRLLYSV